MKEKEDLERKRMLLNYMLSKIFTSENMLDEIRKISGVPEPQVVKQEEPNRYEKMTDSSQPIRFQALRDKLARQAEAPEEGGDAETGRTE